MELNLFDYTVLFFFFIVFLCSLIWKNKDKRWLITDDPTQPIYDRNSDGYMALCKEHSELSREILFNPELEPVLSPKLERVSMLLREYDKAADKQYMRSQHGNYEPEQQFKETERPHIEINQLKNKSNE